jgi:CHAT domain-containing protein
MNRFSSTRLAILVHFILILSIWFPEDSLMMAGPTGVMAGPQQAGRVKELAERLAKSNSEAEQDTLLDKEKDLVTAALVRALLARGASENGSPPKAIKAYEAGRRVAERLDDKPLLAASLYGLGWNNLMVGEYARGMNFLQKSLELKEALGDKLGTAWALEKLGDGYRMQGDHKSAREFYKRSKSMGEELVNKPLLSELNLVLGLIEPKTEEALKFFQESLILAQESGDKPRAANAMIKIATALRLQGKTTEALGYVENGLLFSEQLGNKRMISFALDSLGETHRILGNYAQALENFQKALVINQELGNKVAHAEAFNKIGLVHYWQGDYAQALSNFNEALTRSLQLGNKHMIARSTSHLGQTYMRLGNHQSALEHNLAALKLREEIGEKDGVADTAGNLGNLYDEIGDYPQALNYYQLALMTAENVSKRHAAFALKGMATVYNKQGKYELAVEPATKAAAFAREIGNREYVWRALMHLGTAYRGLNRPELGLQSFEEAILTVEQLRSNVAGQQSRATYFASVLELYEKYIDLLMQLHKVQPSQGYDARAFQGSEQARARSLLEVLSYGTTIRHGADPQLLERARSLQQQLNDRAERQERMIGGEDANALAREIEKLTRDYQEVEVKILQSSPRYAALTQPKPAKVDEIQKSLLDPDTAILEYSLGESRSYLWLLTQTSLLSYELPKRAEIETSVRRVVELLRNGRRWTTSGDISSEFAVASRSLGNTLLPPDLWSRIKVKRLVIIGDGALQYLPFGALPGPTPNVRRPNSSRKTPLAQQTSPLISDFEIVTLPSASTLQVLRQEMVGRPRGARVLAVLADPVFEESDHRVQSLKSAQNLKGSSASPVMDATIVRASASRTLLERAFRVETTASIEGVKSEPLRIPRLPFTRLEADGVIATAPPEQSLKATDFRANRETATSPELAQYRYLHFATHGILNSEHPELSGIVLSLVSENGKPVDGFLRLHDIYNLNLPADLVVLSACQTGLGKEIRGEGLVGLTRGFMYAGSPRVVASLWKVDDAATAELMKRFYRGMLKDKLPPAAALRAAKVEMWQQKRWNAPFYWAAFELQGEWK